MSSSKFADDDDDVSVYSSDALLSLLSPEARQALQTHLDEKKQQTQNVTDVSENYGMSQFWYTDSFSSRLADEVIHLAKLLLEKKQKNKKEGSKVECRIACVSCPTLMKSLKSLSPAPENMRFTVFEFDRRFATAYPEKDEYIYYDYNFPTTIPSELKGQFDVIVVDPPYLNVDVASAFAATCKYISHADSYWLFNTAAHLREYFEKELKMKPLRDTPEHSSLKNDFYIYSNYPSSKNFGDWRKDDQTSTTSNQS